MIQNILKFMGIVIIGLWLSSCEKSSTSSNPQVSGFMTNSEMSDSQRPLAGDSMVLDSGITEINLDVQKIVFRYKHEEKDKDDKDEDGENKKGYDKENDEDSVIVLAEPFNLNLLDLDKDSLISFINTNAPVGRLKEIRLILGKDNYVMKDSVKYALKVPSGKSSGIKIKVKGLLKAGEDNQFTVDFRLRESFKKDGTGKYYLRPVIKVKIAKGSLEGEDSDGSDD